MAPTTHVLLLADTHLRGAQIDAFVDRLRPQLERADAILHAGDVVDEALLTELAAHAPVIAVAGNNDVGSELPETIEHEIAGVTVAMVHDSGPARGRTERLARRFPDADVVVFGHSHLPWHETTVADGRRRHHVNPGSPTQRRRAPTRTVGWLVIDADRRVVIDHEDV